MLTDCSSATCRAVPCCRAPQQPEHVFATAEKLLNQCKAWRSQELQIDSAGSSSSSRHKVPFSWLWELEHLERTLVELKPARIRWFYLTGQVCVSVRGDLASHSSACSNNGLRTGWRAVRHWRLLA
jgi:hypothetical protein